MTAALHGNELNGIPLIHRLFSQELQLSALHGTVVAVPVTNVPGYLSGVRTFNDGVDLNRLMPGYVFVGCMEKECKMYVLGSVQLLTAISNILMDAT